MPGGTSLREEKPSLLWEGTNGRQALNYWQQSYFLSLCFLHFSHPGGLFSQQWNWAMSKLCMLRVASSPCWKGLPPLSLYTGKLQERRYSSSQRVTGISAWPEVSLNLGLREWTLFFSPLLWAGKADFPPAWQLLRACGARQPSCLVCVRDNTKGSSCEFNEAEMLNVAALSITLLYFSFGNAYLKVRKFHFPCRKQEVIFTSSSQWLNRRRKCNDGSLQWPLYLMRAFCSEVCADFLLKFR